ncbi:MAG: hypothetical protein HUU35_09435 [Armatimonadetes bacterium]|nr:hypothetical protein [Armatimonadota bacterium]
MPSARRLLPLLALPLLACPAYEGPIDVILVDMDDSAELSWAEAGSSTFEPCTNGTTNPEATAGCGPYGVGKPGDYTVTLTARDKDQLKPDGTATVKVVVKAFAEVPKAPVVQPGMAMPAPGR